MSIPLKENSASMKKGLKLAASANHALVCGRLGCIIAKINMPAKPKCVLSCICFDIGALFLI